MALIVRSRYVNAAPDAVWELVADASTLPRWWPRVNRVEGVTETGFTMVMISRRGRPIRLDLSYVEVELGTSLAWELALAGSAFERMLSHWRTRVVLTAEGEGTRVGIEEDQSFRGSFRTGSFLQRRAARKRVAAALAGLAQLC